MAAFFGTEMVKVSLKKYPKRFSRAKRKAMRAKDLPCAIILQNCLQYTIEQEMIRQATAPSLFEQVFGKKS